MLLSALAVTEFLSSAAGAISPPLSVHPGICGSFFPFYNRHFTAWSPGDGQHLPAREELTGAWPDELRLG